MGWVAPGWVDIPGWVVGDTETTGTITATSTFSGVGHSTFTGAASISASSTFTGVGHSTFTGAGSIAATSSFSGVGHSTFTGAASISASSTFTGVGASEFRASASIAATSAFSGVGHSTFSGAGGIAATSTFTFVSATSITPSWVGTVKLPGGGVVYEPLRVPLERPNSQAQLHRSEIARGVHALERSLPTAANLPLSGNTTAGTSWTSLAGLPVMVGWENVRQLELAGELQWQHTAAALPDGNEQPFEVRVLVDRVPIHTAEIQLQQVRQTLPAPSILAAGSFFFLTPLQRLSPGAHQLNVQVQAYTGATWTVLSTSTIRYATY